MRDSIFRAQTADKVAKYKTLYETEKTNAENQELLATTHTKNILIKGIIVLAALLLLLLWFAYNRYRIKKESEFEKQNSVHKILRYKAALEAEEKERARIARELHDSLGQTLSTTKMMLSVVAPIDENSNEVLNESMKVLDQAVQEVRTISHNLMPSSLAELGIGAALKELARNINATGKTKISLEVSEAVVLNKDKEVITYRIVQELVHNAVKHTHCTQIAIKLQSAADGYLLQVQDNGNGFDVATIHNAKGIGWQNIFLRVDLLGGTIDVNSAADSGTIVRIIFS